jgi:GntR family transcriptional regulator, transcriptional repressor for pyruvate dehydrogenase complex
VVPAVHRPKLADQIYEQLLQQIANGTYPTGARLPSESALAEGFGVSRPVLREALSRLRADGVVMSRHGSGSYVERRPHADLLKLGPVGNIADLMRCYELRVAIEGEAAFLAATRRTQDDVSAMREALRELDRAIAKRELGAEADLHFHLAVMRASKNRLFENALEALSTHISQAMSLARRLSLRASLARMQLVQQEHKRVVDAIQAEDAPAARDAVRTHIENARVRVLTDSTEPA